MKVYVITTRLSSDPETPQWMKVGYIKAHDLDDAAEKILSMHGLSWDDVDDTESGGWGGRPDNYLLLIVCKNGNFWGDVDLKIAPALPSQVINDVTLEESLKYPYPHPHTPKFAPAEGLGLSREQVIERRIQGVAEDIEKSTKLSRSLPHYVGGHHPLDRPGTEN